MNGVEIKNKLTRIIKLMLISVLEDNQEIPQKVLDFVLKNHGWTTEGESGEDSKEDLNDFVKNLECWVEDNRSLTDHTGDTGMEFEFNYNPIFEKYLEVSLEYSEVMSDLMRILEEILNFKVTHSHNFKNKCKGEDNKIEILNGKAQFLKLQFFLKLYSEKNAFISHLKLQKKLKKELDTLKTCYNNLIERNKQYDDIKNDKQFCELFKLFKGLKKMEKKTEIIGQM